ncbi:MAG: hypothetical protein L0Y44_06650 [Phycisphaerales bacterium]|nr:hypothetical protein [Phycisphaerales bacterium]
MSRKRARKREGVLTEDLLVATLVEFLSEDGYRVRLEVPNMGQCADVVCTRNRWVTFFEAKLRNWQRALEQCRAHQSVADFVCVALSVKNVPDRLERELDEAGYGLIVCDVKAGRCEWLVHPRRNRQVWPPQRKRLAAMMRGINHES